MGTIRGDFSSDRERNVIHGSHSDEAARKEIDIWFHPDEVTPWISADETVDSFLSKLKISTDLTKLFPNCRVYSSPPEFRIRYRIERDKIHVNI